MGPFTVYVINQNRFRRVFGTAPDGPLAQVGRHCCGWYRVEQQAAVPTAVCHPAAGYTSDSQELTNHVAVRQVLRHRAQSVGTSRFSSSNQFSTTRTSEVMVSSGCRPIAIVVPSLEIARC